MTTNLENSAVATGLEKVSFSFQSQRKAMPKNAQTTAQLHSSHTLLLLLLLLLLVSHSTRVWLCATPEMAAHQASPSLGFSRQEHWSELPFLSPMHESERWKWSCSVGSRLVTIFSQCFKYFNSLSPWAQEGEVGYNLYLCSSVGHVSLFSPLGCF